MTKNWLDPENVYSLLAPFLCTREPSVRCGCTFGSLLEWFLWFNGIVVACVLSNRLRLPIWVVMLLLMTLCIKAHQMGWQFTCVNCYKNNFSETMAMVSSEYRRHRQRPEKRTSLRTLLALPNVRGKESWSNLAESTRLSEELNHSAQEHFSFTSSRCLQSRANDYYDYELSGINYFDELCMLDQLLARKQLRSERNEVKNGSLTTKIIKSRFLLTSFEPNEEPHLKKKSDNHLTKKHKLVHVDDRRQGNGVSHPLRSK